MSEEQPEQTRCTNCGAVVFTTTVTCGQCNETLITPATESARLLLAKNEELRHVREDVMALTRLHLRNLVAIDLPNARYLGVNVTKTNDGGDSYVVCEVEGVYDAEGNPLEFAGEWDDSAGLLNDLQEYDEVMPNDYTTYGYDLIGGGWRDTVPSSIMPPKEALDFAIFAIRTWQEPSASDAKDVTALEENAERVVDMLAKLREWVIAQGEDFDARLL